MHRLTAAILATSVILLAQPHSTANALLYANEPNEVRQVQTLDGMWNFVAETSNSLGYGFANDWPNEDFGVRFTNAALRSHVGWVWYQRYVRLPKQLVSDSSTNLVLRFGSVNYYCAVYWNGHLVGNHTGGHLPFEFELSKSILESPGINFLTVAVNNTLSAHTIPHGEFVYKTDTRVYPEGFFEHTPDFDFFNYAGILRSVVLYTRYADYHVSNVKLKPQINGVDGRLEYEITTSGPKRPKMGYVAIYDPKTIHLQTEMFKMPLKKLGQRPNLSTNQNEPYYSGFLDQPSAIKWEPRSYDKNEFKNKYGYLYMFEVALFDETGHHMVDLHRIPFGFRTVKWDNNTLYINEKPFYCKGFGMHEDTDVRGRGHDPVMTVKDFNMLEWLGANCFRTSHYPYAEERYQEADKRGIVIVSETPGVGLRHFTPDNLATHKEMLADMINRDFNHPSVIAWSLANEPQTYQTSSRPYFSELIKLAHSMDDTRPVTIVYGPTGPSNDKTADMIDIICVNRYYGWYIDMGYPQTIAKHLAWDLTQWHEKFNKPIIMTEYGAGSMNGVNADPPTMDFTESYQVNVLQQTWKAFDQLKALNASFLAGVKRVAGNRKGILTRNRQPKMAAYAIRGRYHSLDGCHNAMPFAESNQDQCVLH